MKKQYDDSTADMRETVFSKNIPNFVHEKFLDYVGKTPNRGRILDIGTGPGSQAILLRERGYEISASDISQVILEKAKKEAKRRNLKKSTTNLKHA